MNKSVVNSNAESAKSHCRFCAEKKLCTELLLLSEEPDVLSELQNCMKSFKIDFIDFSIENRLPRTICLACFTIMKSFRNFLNSVFKAQDILSNIYVETKDMIVFDAVNEEIAPVSSEITPEHIKLEKPEIILNVLNEQQDYYEPTPVAIDLTNDHYGKDKKIRFKKNQRLWNKYKWTCAHCNRIFVDIMTLRIHLRSQHNLCFGFHCVDCNEKMYNYAAFIDHVVDHRKFLRIFCEFCKKKFASQKDCFDHMKSHIDSRHFCKECGSLFRDKDCLRTHQEMFNPLARGIMVIHQDTWNNKEMISTDLYSTSSTLESHCFQEEECQEPDSGSWSTYEWTCSTCLSKFEDVEKLRKHSQETHKKCFTMKCVDCDKICRRYTMFVNHVIKHRSYLRSFCQYCNEYIPDNNELARHLANKHIKGDQRPCDGCGQTFKDIKLLKIHMQKYGAPRKLEFVTTEDLTCNNCSKLFSTVESVRKHKKVHEDRQRDFMCHTCGKSFFDRANLINHINTHNPEYVSCKICNQQFKSKRQLRIHVSVHLEVKQFICHDCGKACRTKRQLQLHIMTHSNVLNFKCQFCDKAFRLKTGLNVHMTQHTGIRPYKCECCDMTFTNWANCNKRMIRRHGVTLAKTKRTSKGAVAISREVGAPIEPLKFDENDLKWINNTMASNKRGRRKTVKTE